MVDNTIAQHNARVADARDRAAVAANLAAHGIHTLDDLFAAFDAAE
ncbi:hypothetical protein SEA_VINCENZO_97 [Mycobacterium phage Vincenzo]|uniref:Uncharacterized protein n=2 Tax=Coopervirus vincenzo TaxID=1983110 RepID=A0A0F6WDY8_9CAUD|nr:hypothetical protein SEA_VINCENZO_97 [Mycobacterium phage Vincenzo]AKF14359.1 hypothetical protein SEA_VINCENZO_97 [Mycobacterium phage Vincenzo]AKF14763.1 hypothetical protein SEA_ALANGRANT_98 [Mycobacterium phage AlanGrant]